LTILSIDLFFFCEWQEANEEKLDSVSSCFPCNAFPLNLLHLLQLAVLAAHWLVQKNRSC